MYTVRVKPRKRDKLATFNSRQKANAQRAKAPGYWWLHATKGWRWEKF